MTQSLREEAARLRAVGQVFADGGVRLRAADPGPRAFGTDGPGAIGQLSDELYAAWGRALGSRAEEAAAHSSALNELAGSVLAAADAYDDTDHAAHARHPAVG